MTDTVNKQVTDAVTQTATSIMGNAPAQSMGMVYQSMAHSISLLMQNSVSAQGGMQQINAAVIASACKQILAAPSQAALSQAAASQAYPPRMDNYPNLPPSVDKPDGPSPTIDGQGETNGDNKETQKNTQKQLDEAHKLAEHSLKRAMDAAKQAADYDSEALKVAEDMLTKASSELSDLESQKKVKKVFHLARESTIASQNASAALVKTQSLVSKALLNTSDPEIATHYAIQAEHTATEAEEAAAQAKEAVKKAKEAAM
ncbi:MAG: hypothetical protein F6K36_24640 [Symploca sp. SIO3C6]|nr:hypothetical protein [Symploca sp. SIO3C6]